MSFDDGFHLDLVSGDNFAAKFSALLQDRGMSFRELCQRAKVDSNRAFRAIEQGVYGMQQNTELLQRMLHVLGKDIAWLTLAPNHKEQGRDEQRLELFELAFQFSRKSELDKGNRAILIREVMKCFEKQPTDSLRRVARSVLPRDIVGMAAFYEDLKRNGLIIN